MTEQRTLSAAQQQALALVEEANGLDLVGEPFDEETSTFAVARDGEVLDFASAEGLEFIAMMNGSWSVEEYLEEAADLYEAGVIDVRIVQGGLKALA